MELTFKQAMKVWWSFVWRSSLLGVVTAPVLYLPFFIILYFLGAYDNKPSMTNTTLLIPIIFVFWLSAVTLLLAVQVISMKWALKVKWADFHLELKERGKTNF